MKNVKNMASSLWREEEYERYMLRMSWKWGKDLLLGPGPEECNKCADLDSEETFCKRISKMVIPGYEDGKDGIPRNFFLRCPFKA